MSYLTTTSDFRFLLGLYYRRVGTEIDYWLRTIGYDHRDKSVSNRIYRWYLIGFGLIWVFAMWALVANFANSVANFLPDDFQVWLEGAMMWYVLAFQTWMVVEMVRHSPVRLNFLDMEHIATAPVSRGAIVTVRYLWGLIPRIVIFSMIGVILAMMAGSRFGTGDSGIAGIYALISMIPLVASSWAIAWLFGMIRLQVPAIDERRVLLWGVPVAMVALGLFLPDIGLMFGHMLVATADLSLNFFMLIVLSVFAVVALPVIFRWGERVSMIKIIDESQAFARIAELGLLAWQSPDLVNQINRQVALASKRPRERLPDVPGQYMLLVRALVYYGRRPGSMARFAVWAAIATMVPAFIYTSGAGFDLATFAGVSLALIFSVPRGITELYSLDQGEPFLRRIIPASNLQLLLMDAWIPTALILLTSSMTWYILTASMDGLLILLLFVPLLVLIRGASVLTLPTFPTRFEFAPTMVIALVLIVLGSQVAGFGGVMGMIGFLIMFFVQSISATG